MAVRMQTSRRLAAQRRKLIWARHITENAAMTNPQQIDLLDEFRTVNGGAQPIGSTVTRVVISYAQARVAASAVAGSGVIVGLIVAPTIAAQVPLPVTQPHEDWMYWKYLRYWDAGRASQGQAAWDFDVRSQRKMAELGQTLWFVAQAQPFVATDTFSLAASVLLRLP